jgi:hypothetical protein
MRVVLAAFIPIALVATTAASAADGCAPGTFSITNSPDGRAASVLFDDFSATGGGGSPGTTSVCDLQVPVTLPSGAVGVYKVDYRGFTFLAAQQSTQLSVKHAVGTDVTKIDGPFDGDIAFSDTIGGGQSGTLDSRITLVLKSAADLEDALAAIDSIDVAEIGFTTLASVGDSLDKLAEERIGLTTHLGGTADLLLGFNQPVDGPSGASALAAFGSTTLGANGRWDLNGGFSLLGGAAYVAQSAGGAAVNGSALIAGGVRYIQPGAEAIRFFGEAGIWGSPDLALRFTRPYANGTGEGDTSGSLVSVYARAGVRYMPNPTNEIALSGTLARNWLNVDGYAEPGGPGNLFPATVAGGTATSDLFKATLAWTSQVTSRFDFTLSAAVGRTFGGSSPVAANVDWVGAVTGVAGDVTFVEYGARTGWKVTANTTLDAFVIGTSGDRIGSHTQFGGAVRVRF